MSRIFIDRPIFAWVIAIIVMLAGLGAIFSLPIAQYPDVAPPQVIVRATYPGASAEALQNSVTQVLEQSLGGIDGLLYFSSSSTSRGAATITATFEKGTNPDIAQVQVQNQVQQALSRLPQQVQQQGLRVAKSNPDALLLVGVYDTTDKLTNRDVADWLTSNLQDPLGRVPGVGDSQVFGAPYAMRIWLNPDRLASFSLMPSDVVTAIQNQNTEVAAGEIGGQPMPPEQMLNATVTAQSRLQTPAQFANITLKTDTSGATVHLRDVARVELGSDNYNAVSRLNGHPGAGMSVSLAPGADALTTADAVKELISKTKFPPGMTFAYANDSTAFIKLSITEVVWTLIEAIGLVVVVMFVFLQTWRATLIPTIAVPVVLLGTFAILYVAGYSINTLTLFGLVLSIGLLVDDAIVVVENVERLLEENPGMGPREATIKSMDQIQVALVAIALVLSAVFLPMAFFGGSTGVIYRQFSITIVSSMVLSVLVALILTPALTSSLLKPKKPVEEGDFENGGNILVRTERRFFLWFNDRFDRGQKRYERGVRTVIDRTRSFMIAFVCAVGLLGFLFIRLPTGFLPTEDIGQAIVQYFLPAGATQDRTAIVSQATENYFLHKETNVESMFSSSGRNLSGFGDNVGQAYLILKPWDDRKGAQNSADAITRRAQKVLGGMRDARVITVLPPAIRGLGQTNGFTLEVQNLGGLSREQFAAAKDRLIAEASKDPLLDAVRLGSLEDTPHLHIDVDEAKVGALGIAQGDVNSTLSAAWGGTYVNDFIDRGRVKRVYIEGDAPYRGTPEDLAAWHVRSSTGTMAPFSAFAATTWGTGPSTLQRFNGISSYEIQGQASAGHSSGAAMDRIEQLASEIPGLGTSWSGLSYQERLSTGQAPYLYALSILVIFLCLAALYESWSIPVSVLLVIPLGVIGAVLAVLVRGLDNDIYFQVGLLTTIGLSAKNAILIVEFAEFAEQRGQSPIEAALEAARLRLRPILMTSLAFVAGVIPLAIATGAGAQSRVAIGTAVVGGMITATTLAIFFVPMFFVLVRSLFRGGHGGRHEVAAEG